MVDRVRRPGWYWPIALLLAGFYVVTSLYMSAHRLLWFDEILTAFVSRMPDVRTMWKSLSEIAEQTPPLYFLVTRMFDQIFHHADIGLRVPSALALGVGLLVTFDIARRLTDGLYGLIAMSLLTISFVTYYGQEARPYALYFMLSTVAIWIWLFTSDESKSAAAVFGAVFLCGIGVHFYFILCLAPFGILALTQGRIFHPKVVAATGGVMISLALLYPQIENSRSFANSIGSVWAPSTARLQVAFLELFPNAILPLVVVAAGAVVFGRPRERMVPCMSAGERLGWVFLMMPLAAYVLAHLVTHVFHNRYIIGAAPGIVVGMTCLLWRHCRESRNLSVAILVAVGGFGVSQHLRTMRGLSHIPTESGDYQDRTLETLSLEDTLLREGKQHVMVPWDIQYLETWYYTKHKLQYECVTSEARWAIRNYVPLQFVSVAEIVANARQTAVIAPSPVLTAALERAGLHLKVRFVEPQYVVYLE